MIPYLGCEAARELLEPFVDGELPMAEQVAVESHLRWCDTLRRARRGHAADRRRASRRAPPRPPVHPEDAARMAAIQSEVLARIRAEREQSLSVRVREVFADMRFLWPALGATAALVACLFAVRERATGVVR